MTISSYSPQVLKHFRHPHNFGSLKKPDSIGTVGNPVCGDVMKLYLKIGKNKEGQEVIKNIKFETLGCPAAIATSSVVTDLAKGKTLGSALNITKDDVIKVLGNLPPAKIHCSLLAVDALHKAINMKTTTNHCPPCCSKDKTKLPTSLIITAIIVFLYYLLNRLNLVSQVNIGPDSLPPVFFGLGLVAGFSTCSATVGGLLVSLNQKQKSIKPTLLFNLGRLISFSALGYLLGFFGSFFQFSMTAGAIFTIIISIIMIGFALEILGFEIIPDFKIKISLFQKKIPLIIGALTFLLPCGFTLTVQAAALSSGNPIRGVLSLFFFALGTSVPLFLIGYSTVKSQKNPSVSKYFSQVTGILILLFSVFNIISQLNLLGLNPVFAKNGKSSAPAPIVNGYQIIKMNVGPNGYTPNSFTVKAGVPIRWEITDNGATGCTNGIISRSLFSGTVYVNPNIPVVKDLPALSPGKYRFTCWMGMISGFIEVIP